MTLSTGTKTNSGYMAVGHLLANKEPGQYKQALKHFCTLIFVNLSDDVVEKDAGFWRYEQFFKSVDVNVNSYAKFLGGILRRHQTNEWEFQLQIERIAWDVVKLDYCDRFCSEAIDRKTLFRLFCLFNRVCRSEGPDMMKVTPKAAAFVLRRIGVAVANNAQVPISFAEFLDLLLVEAQQSNDLTLAIKKLYDEMVRDVIKEARIRCKIVRKGFSSNAQPRIVTVTSQNLTVFDQGNYESWDEPQFSEPSGNILCRLTLVDVETKLTKATIFNRDTTLRVFSSSDSLSPKVELLFDSAKDVFELYSWGQSIQEGKESRTQLQKIFVQFDLHAESSPRPVNKFLRNAVNHPRQRSHSSECLNHVTRIFINGTDSASPIYKKPLHRTKAISSFELQPPHQDSDEEVLNNSPDCERKVGDIPSCNIVQLYRKGRAASPDSGYGVEEGAN